MLCANCHLHPPLPRCSRCREFQNERQPTPIVCPVCKQVVTALLGTRPSKLCTDKDGWTYEHVDMEAVRGGSPW